MIRTRDFLLVASVVTFLVVGIGATLTTRHFSGFFPSEEPVQFVTEETGEQEALVVDDESGSRDIRLSNLRKKIAEGAELFIYDTELESDLTEEEQETAATGIQYCDSYTTYITPWDPNNLSFREVEGTRALYRTTLNAAIATGSATTKEELVTYLPIPSGVSAVPSCISSDVVGLTASGALIRNNAALYSNYSEQTFIGYALDGFPIYGPTTADTDVCGGKLTNGLYGYHVSLDNHAVLSCFSAAPISL